MAWQGHGNLHRHTGDKPEDWQSYACGHCGHKIVGAIVASYPGYRQPQVRWMFCPECERGSVLNGDYQLSPGSKSGPEVLGLPSEVDSAYDEARRCMSANAFTATELVCRKILMHLAADKGAKEGDTFVNYLTYLEKQGYVTPPMKPWVDLIRSHGNKATHEIDTPEHDRAESTLLFTAELLRLVYEMEHYSRKYAAKAE